MMPSVVTAQQRSEDQFSALKKYIMRDRQRKKQEQEADAEVQRQRREREQKQKQDVMTLGETKEQISQLETRLAALNEEKHQLFLTLKKVLNEEDFRKKQAVKETANELMGVNASYSGLGNPSLFLQPMQNRPQIYKVGPTPNNNPGPSGTKRLRSPSPPTAQGPPYHHYNSYKSPNFQHKPEDGRRNNEYVRAVLWNKGPAAAAATYGGVYGVAHSPPVYSYTATPPATYEPVYLHRQNYEKVETDKMYLRGPAGQLPMPVHPAPHPKAGGISSGFPVRASHSVYLTPGGTNNSRLLYGSAPTSVTAARYQSSGAM